MIIDLTRAEAVACSRQVSALYGAAFGYPPAMVRRFTQTYTRCMAEYDGARVLLARSDGAAVGFAFGFTFQRGHWWPEQVGPELDAAGHGAWMHDAFELAELAVDPGHQGQGIGTALLQRVLYTTGHQRVLLATTPQNPARRLYRRHGFAELLPDFRYPHTGTAAVVMGARAGTDHQPDPPGHHPGSGVNPGAD